MPHTLVTLLGKGRNDAGTGYRKATYRFPDETKTETAFFGLALADHLKVDRVVILGTPSSQWGVLVEHLAAEGEDEDARLELMDAEAKERVDQQRLDALAGLMALRAGRKVIPRLIPFGRNASEQYAILDAIAAAVPSGTVSFDVTHGFRHLGMVGFLAAFMLERVRRLNVHDLWYGALDMTREGVTPVLKLDGMVRVRRWVEALDRFDATGDYGIFAPLLIQDGVKESKAACLERAAFFERTSNVWDAARQLGTFFPVLKKPLASLAGASGLFKDRLADRLAWAREHDIAAKQRKLARQYLDRGDYLRAAIFGLEACVTRICEAAGVDPVMAPYTDRQEEVEAFRTGAGHGTERGVYRKLNAIRNALAHGTPPSRPEDRNMLKDPTRLRDGLAEALTALDRLFQ